jgi:hypothetical protein
VSSLADKVADMMSLRKARTIDQTKLSEQRERGAKAEALLRDEALQLAFRQLDEGYQLIWRNTSPDDVETRERAWTSLKVLDDVRNLLISTVQNGAAAQQELEKALRR